MFVFTPSKRVWVGTTAEGDEGESGRTVVMETAKTQPDEQLQWGKKACQFASRTPVPS